MTDEPTRRSLKRPFLLAAPGVLGWLLILALFLGAAALPLGVIEVLTPLSVVCAVLALLVLVWAGFRLRGDDKRPLSEATIFALGANGTLVVFWVIAAIATVL